MPSKPCLLIKEAAAPPTLFDRVLERRHARELAAYCGRAIL
jgi:hypothetical protein